MANNEEAQLTRELNKIKKEGIKIASYEKEKLKHEESERIFLENLKKQRKDSAGGKDKKD